MYHSGKNPLRKVTYKSEGVATVKSPERRRLHKALLRYHDPANWPLIREALKQMKLAHLIGDGPSHLVPLEQPAKDEAPKPARRKNTKEAHERRIKRGRALTQHTGLPPRRTR
ncbi:MAG: DUF3362 domain-containing protein [Xanthomonadales bacterium]|nr:DUF3362 domain-containing protein [Xanthomonadales bacterium]